MKSKVDFPAELDAVRDANLVQRIKTGQAGTDQELWKRLAGGLRLILRRTLDEQRAETEVRLVLAKIVETIRAGGLQEPSQLPTVARRIVRERIRQISEGGHVTAGPPDRGLTPPTQKPGPEAAAAILERLLVRDREILTRFYAQRQPVDEICRELKLTTDDVEIVKATARALFSRHRRHDSHECARAGTNLPDGRPLKVLQVEDSESDAALIVRQLEMAGHTVRAQRVEDAEQMRRALARESWDVIIADHRLPQFDAPGALRVLRESCLDTPFIVVSGTIGEETAVAMLKSGAHDYLLKGNLARLVPAVERELREAWIRRERQQAVQALAEHQERLALAVSAANVGTFDFYPATGKLVLSESAKRQLGLAAGDAVDYDAFLQTVCSSDRQRVDQLIRHALRQDSGGQYAAEYRTSGSEYGAERWLSSSGRVFFGEAGSAQRFIGVTVDITDRRQLQDDLQQLQRLESIARVAGGVAHDFNNLLTVIGGEAQLAAEGLSPGDPLREPMDAILSAVTRASGLTRQLLTFSRQQLNAPRPVLLNDLVRGMHTSLRRVVGELVDLVLALDDKLLVVRADPVQLQQVLMNLVENARDAMPDGGRLLVRTALCTVDGQMAVRRGVSPGVYSMLSVSDTGMGIDPEVQSRVFEPFFTTKQGKGTGLGLATVYGIVKQNHGAICVESQLGQGSTFTMLFPVVDGAPGAGAPQTP